MTMDEKDRFDYLMESCPDCGAGPDKPCPGTVRQQGGCLWKRMIGQEVDGSPIALRAENIT